MSEFLRDKYVEKVIQDFFRHQGIVDTKLGETPNVDTFILRIVLFIFQVEVKPYVLDDQLCDECQGARCGGKFAPFFCANVTCLQVKFLVFYGDDTQLVFTHSVALEHWVVELLSLEYKLAQILQANQHTYNF